MTVADINGDMLEVGRERARERGLTVSAAGAFGPEQDLISEDPEIRSLAFDISSTQTNQAGRMEGWLSLWGLPSSGGEVMAWMADTFINFSDPTRRWLGQSVVTGKPVDFGWIPATLAALALWIATVDGLVHSLDDGRVGVPDEGGPTLNLTQTPDVDEFEGVWSPDGSAIAVASDAGAGAPDAAASEAGR